MSGSTTGAPYFIGMMAGTSLDGIDTVLLAWPEHGNLEVVAAQTTPYSPDLVEAIRATGPSSPLNEISQLDARLGETFGTAATGLLKTCEIDAHRVRALASHGQTVWHAPDSTYPTSIQLGDPNRLARACGIDVVADFRRSDMAAGGQGAPLAPLFHQAFFGSSEDKAVLNLGGIGNITLLASNGHVTGFDTGPANTLLDAWHHRHTGIAIDRNGAWAADGCVLPQLLSRMLSDPFFHQQPPRSTGPEHFNLDWVEQAIGDRPYDPADVQATLAELTARSAANALTDHMPHAQSLLVCGGGVHNQHLMSRIDAHLPCVTVASTQTAGISPDWVEAIGFVWLARQTLAGRPCNTPPVTGAHTPVVLGGIYPSASLTPVQY